MSSGIWDHGLSPWENEWEMNWIPIPKLLREDFPLETCILGGISRLATLSRGDLPYVILYVQEIGFENVKNSNWGELPIANGGIGQTMEQLTYDQPRMMDRSTINT